MAEIHPWDTPDAEQLKLVFAGLALAHDAAAEQIVGAGAHTDKHGVKRATPDIVTFATAVSKTAAERMQDAQLVETRYPGVSLADPDTRAALYPEAQLPYWPYFGGGYDVADWQHEDAHQITAPFVRGIVAAGRIVEAEASHLLGACCDFPVSPSAFYGAVGDVVEGQILLPAGSLLESAEQQLAGGASLPQDVIAIAYDSAHEGYVQATLALCAAVAPAMLGPEFVREA